MSYVHWPVAEILQPLLETMYSCIKTHKRIKDKEKYLEE